MQIASTALIRREACKLQVFNNASTKVKGTLHITIGLLIYVLTAYCSRMFFNAVFSFIAFATAPQLTNYAHALETAAENGTASATTLLFTALFSGLCTVLYYKKVFNFKILAGVYSGAKHIKAKQIVLLPAFIIIGHILSFLTQFFENILYNYFSIAQISQPALPKEHFALFTSFLALCVVPAIFEELIFRGILLNFLAQKKPFLAMAAVSLLFCFLHANIAEMPAIFILSFILCYIYYKTNNLLLCILMHFVNNSAAFLQLLF